MRAAIVALALACVTPILPAQAPDAMPVRGDLTWSLLTLDGRRTTLAPLRGRVLVVNSWATWCEPCVAELASMAALREAVPDTLLAFALIAPQRAAPVREFIRRRGLRLPVFLEAAPPPAVFAFDAVPTTWIIDRDGCIVMRHRGAANWNTDALRRQLRALLATPTAPGGQCAA